VLSSSLALLKDISKCLLAYTKVSFSSARDEDMVLFMKRALYAISSSLALLKDTFIYGIYETPIIAHANS